MSYDWADAMADERTIKRQLNDGGMYAKMRKRIDELERRCAKLENMVLAMWDAPGMPGATAILREFDEIKVDSGQP